MIIDERHVGRYAFIFDVNGPENHQGIRCLSGLLPFRIERYIPNFAEFDWAPRIHAEADAAFHQRIGWLIERFVPVGEWLRDRTFAFRMNPVTMADPKKRESPEVLAYMVQVPEDLAVLFRLYWYDG